MKGYKILLVDDEPDMEVLVSQFFRRQIKEGAFNFRFAENGQHALDILAEDPAISLVLTDINMPIMDGLSLLKKINELNRTIQTIVVSAYGDIKNIRIAMNEGAYDFLMKPIDFHDLELTVRSSLDNLQFILDSKETEKQLESEREEKIKAQEEALKLANENANLILDQNRLLEQKVEERTRELHLEKQKSDNLLLNILPPEVAEELKQSGKSEAKQYDNVTVLFADIVNFTGISEKLTPVKLVEEIHMCFTAFDNIVDHHGLEKIKTIGDAYLAVCGMPNEDPEHAQKTIRAAIEMNDFITRRRKEGGHFGIRSGIHSGTVIAGIVGTKKFAYDIWGDTVNIAARMEQTSEEGKINISGATYELVKNNFNCIHRGKVSAKNKGEIDMYFVNESMK
jgi:class 3 adenylate cyclase